jgi:hypothetical protein
MLSARVHFLERVVCAGSNGTKAGLETYRVEPPNFPERRPRQARTANSNWAKMTKLDGSAVHQAVNR